MTDRSHVHHIDVTESRVMTIVGIDPGVHTGFAVWDTCDGEGALNEVETMTFTGAQAWVLDCLKKYKGGPHTLEMVIEDPRGQFVPRSDPRYGSHRLKGLGSVERDCKLWIEFCEFYEIPFRLVKPGKLRRIDSPTFKKMTKWDSRTSEHSRAAAMMVFGLVPMAAKKIL